MRTPEISFEVSVIIPVYNAEKYLRQAVESAISLDAVREVLLVEDKSPDNALEVCHALVRQYSKVKLLRHPHGENRGAGESRNLGLRSATSEFIAFLDADDWYLPNRFEKERDLFKDPSVDGVYSATGFYYEDGQRPDDSRLTTLPRGVPPEMLLEVLLTSRGGRFTTNSITVRRSLFARTGLFDTSLRLHQDTHLWLRLAYFGRLLPGEVDQAVSVRRVHGENRIAAKSNRSRQQLYCKVFESFTQYENVPVSAFRIIF